MRFFRTLMLVGRALATGLAGAVAGGGAGLALGAIAALVLMVVRMSHAWVTIGPQIGWTPFDVNIPIFLGIAGVVIGAVSGVIRALRES